MTKDKTLLWSEIEALLEGEDNWVAIMATAVCALHHHFDFFDWTGFYCVHRPQLLTVGPYQGGHGCLRIPFSQGVCGAAARTKQTQWVKDVRSRHDHIACSVETQSEVVVPVCTPEGELIAVLDIDSNTLDAFCLADVQFLERLAQELGKRYSITQD